MKQGKQSWEKNLSAIFKCENPKGHGFISKNIFVKTVSQ